jgi:hypothetical protein
MAHWITIRKPFDYRWPSGAITFFAEPGEQMVKNEVADFAVDNGYATEGKADGSEARSTKGGRKRRSSRKREAPAAATADTGPADRLGDADIPPDDRAADGGELDRDAG